MMEEPNARPSVPLPRRRRGPPARYVRPYPLDEEGVEPDGIGEIDDEFDAVEIDDVIREARGGRAQAIEPDRF